MQRPAFDCRKVRAGHCVFIPDHSAHTAQARHSPRLFARSTIRSSGVVYPGGQKQSDIKAVRGRRQPCHASVLPAVLQGGDTPHHNKARKPRASVDRRDWRNTWRVDQAQQRAIEVMTHFANFGGNWNNGANSGSRNVNTNTATNSNTNNGSRGVCDDSCNALCTYHMAVQADHYLGWSAWLSCFGEHISGSGRTQSTHERNAEPAIYGQEAQTIVRPHHRPRELPRRAQENTQRKAQVNELSRVQGIRTTESGAVASRSGRRCIHSRTVSHVLHLRPETAPNQRTAVSGSDRAARAKQRYRANIRADVFAVYVCMQAGKRHTCRGQVYSIAPSQRQGHAFSKDRLLKKFR